MIGFESFSWEHLFYYWFHGHNLLVDDQNFKRGVDVKKGRMKYQYGYIFFFSFINLCRVLAVFLFLQILTEREMAGIMLVTVLLF